MRIGNLGDLHIRETNPEYRIDNFKESLKNKLRFIDTICMHQKIDLVLQPGDFFDAAERVSYAMLAEWIDFFNLHFRPDIYTIFGQHDLINHSLLNQNIPLRVLEAATNLFIMNHKLEAVGYPKQHINIYGCSYGEKIPKVKKEENGLNILIIHKMIIKSKKLWEGQEEYSLAKSLLKKYNYDLIVSGDNHQRFIETYEDKTLINMGSLMRTAKNQKDHYPAIAIYDTETKTTEIIEIPVEPFDTVFDTNRIEKEITIKKEIDELVTAFEDKFTASYNFLHNLDKVKKGADEDTLVIFDELASIPRKE